MQHARRNEQTHQGAVVTRQGELGPRAEQNPRAAHPQRQTLRPAAKPHNNSQPDSQHPWGPSRAPHAVGLWLTNTRAHDFTHQARSKAAWAGCRLCGYGSRLGAVSTSKRRPVPSPLPARDNGTLLLEFACGFAVAWPGVLCRHLCCGLLVAGGVLA